MIEIVTMIALSNTTIEIKIQLCEPDEEFFIKINPFFIRIQNGLIFITDDFLYTINGNICVN